MLPKKSSGVPASSFSKKARTRVERCSVDAGPQIDRRLPAEVVVDVRSPGGPDVVAPDSAGALADKEHPVTVSREVLARVPRTTY